MKNKYVPYVPAVLGIGSLVYYVICVLDSGTDTSGIWVWPLFGFLCFLFAGIFFLCQRRGWQPGKTIAARALMGFVIFLFASFFVFEIGVLYGMHQNGREDLDYVLILGGGVVGSTPSPALMSRITTAAQYLETHPDTKAVASGGLGSQDNISEAACIRAELIRLGIRPKRIITEERSSTTAENMRFSRKLVEKDAAVGIVTSNFHVFRSVLTAKAAGFSEVCGIAAPFGGRMLPHYMVREFMTFTAEVFRGNMF